MYHIILGKGFVGNHLAHFFCKNNIEFKIFSQKELDYTNSDTFRQFIEDNNSTIRSVINCSGYTGVPNVDACEDNKELCYNYNVLYPLRIVKLCHTYAVPLVHIGSGCIYSGYDKEYTEQDTPNFGMFSDDASYYSKCKHIFETFATNYRCHVLRIRIPFTSVLSRKNYFTKLLNYDTLINELNSITSLNDFDKFIVKFINTNPNYGVYNVVNPQPIRAEEIVQMLSENGFTNPNWKFIKLSELQTKAKRSNCVLSTQKLKDIGLELPSTRESLIRDIKILSTSQGQDV